jgi:hypothetical protein
VAMKFVQADEDLLKAHYKDLVSKPFFPSLLSYMTSGPVVPMVRSHCVPSSLSLPFVSYLIPQLELPRASATKGKRKSVMTIVLKHSCLNWDAEASCVTLPTLDNAVEQREAQSTYPSTCRPHSVRPLSDAINLLARCGPDRPLSLRSPSPLLALQEAELTASIVRQHRSTAM